MRPRTIIAAALLVTALVALYAVSQVGSGGLEALEAARRTAAEPSTPKGTTSLPPTHSPRLAAPQLPEGVATQVVSSPAMRERLLLASKQGRTPSPATAAEVAEEVRSSAARLDVLVRTALEQGGATEASRRAVLTATEDAVRSLQGPVVEEVLAGRRTHDAARTVVREAWVDLRARVPALVTDPGEAASIQQAMGGPNGPIPFPGG